MTFFESVLQSDTVGYILLRMVITIMLTVAVARVVRSLLKRRQNRKLYSIFIDNAAVIGIYVIGAIAVLYEIPQFEDGLSALVATSGVAALAISLAAQESLGNAVNGMVISMSKPFEVGDRIRLINGNITGYVENITLRHTVIRTFMNSRVIIPNSVINKDMVENSNYMDVRASGWVDLIVPYGVDLEQAEAIVAKVVGDHPNYVDNRTDEQTTDPRVWVYVRALSVYGIELRAQVWTQNVGTSFVTCSDIRRELYREFTAAGIPFARCEIAAPPPAL